jgi:hypothetical protein
MKSKLVCGLTALALTLGVGATVTAGAVADTVWNLESEFRTGASFANPSSDLLGNPGVWSYMQSPALTADVLTGVLPRSDPSSYTTTGMVFESGYCGNPGFDAYRGSGDGVCGAGYYPVIGKTGGTSVLHPFADRLAVVRWKSPIAATVNVDATFSDIDAGGGDGVDWSIDRGNTHIEDGVLVNGGPNGHYESLSPLTVAAGDTVDFSVGPGPAGDYHFDSTRAQIVITSTDGGPAPGGGGTIGGGGGAGGGGSSSPVTPAWFTLSAGAGDFFGFNVGSLVGGPDTPRRITLDYLPYPLKQQPTTGYSDPSVTPARMEVPNKGKWGWWTIMDVARDAAALNKRGIPVALTLKPSGTDTYKGRQVLPGEVFNTEPSLKAQAEQGAVTSVRHPFPIVVKYYQPALPKPAKVDDSKHPCQVIAAALPHDPAPYTPQIQTLLERAPKLGCKVSLKRSSSANIGQTMILQPRAVDGGEGLEIKLLVPQTADMVLTLFPVRVAYSYAPSFDERWRVPSDLGPNRLVRFGVQVTERASSTGNVGQPLAGVHLQLFLDPAHNTKRLGGTEARMLPAVTTDGDGSAEFGVRDLEAGTLRLVATATPRSGPPLNAWTSLTAFRHTTCWKGMEGWFWSTDGVRSPSCAPKATAARFNAQWKDDLCNLLCWIPGVSQILSAPESPEKLTERIVAPNGRMPCPAIPSQSTLNAPLQADPGLGATRQGTLAVATDTGAGLGVAGRVLDLGADGAALTSLIDCPGGGAIDVRNATTQSFGDADLIGHAGGNVIASGGGNVIASGGGNIIASGGGNIIASGGGNIIASGGGN